MEKRSLSELRTLDDDFQEVSSTEWEFIDMSEQEEDLVRRMYRLVGDRWALIAARILGRTPEAIERFWKMAYDPCFAERRLKRRKRTSSNHGNGDARQQQMPTE
ncbi:MYB-like transcription factor ETC3 [Zingiber officinale]|uniref:MYB-like transcription factor ETC3 n=1 Tax=Zingiber officinale TaxID=94328 RepID=UPI001C4B910C|nr:MYB-like transcription factor ETC3 [Zingiber officinale]